MSFASKGMAFFLRRSRSDPSDDMVPVVSRSVDAPPLYEGTAWMPAEHALLLSVQLPKMKAAQRRAAVAFAVEEFVTQPLEDVHVALGPEISSGAWLVAVVGKTAMQAHAAHQKTLTRLLPDVLALPVPPSGWSVWAGQSRVLVRQADGTGFATDRMALPMFWSAAGMPSITLYGGSLPEGLPVSEQAQFPETFDTSLAGFSLLTGRYGAKGQGIPKGLIPLAAMLGVAIIGHLSVQIVDVTALNRIAAAREGDLRDLLKQPVGTDLETALARALAARMPTSDAGLLPLVAEIFSIIAPSAGSVSLQDLRYNRGDQAVTMTLDAPNLVALQRVEADLVAAGLRVSAGAATTGDGNARVQMILQPGGI